MPTPDSPSSAEKFRRQLLEDGVLSHPDAILDPLEGGVSSDIYRARDGEKIFVVKRALPRLRVEDEWFADVARNRFEVAYIERVREIAPANLPRVFHHDEKSGYFTMEFLGPEFENWKTLMLGGHCELRHAELAGGLLGKIHRATWGDPGLHRDFETTENFHALRLEPYLLATAKRHPRLRQSLEAETDRIRQSRQCLVHGDFSPKNLLFNGDRIVLLDCEVAWFGDAAFDLAFFLNHLALKALHLTAHRDRMLAMTRAAWDAYREENDQPGIDPALARLLPMLMLARVDGKSPLEYLTTTEKNAVREYAGDCIANPADNTLDFLHRWRVFLRIP